MNFIFYIVGKLKGRELKKLYTYIGKFCILFAFQGKFLWTLHFPKFKIDFENWGFHLNVKNKLFITHLIDISKSDSIWSIPYGISKYESTKVLKFQMSYKYMWIKRVVWKKCWYVSQSAIDPPDFVCFEKTRKQKKSQAP